MANHQQNREQGIALRAARLPVTMLLVLAFALITGATAGAAVFYVDGPNPSASDTNPGTEALPYRTITAAIANGGPGVTVFVKPGIYRETATVTTPGNTDNPFVLQATGPGALIDGADDFSAAAQWTLVSGNVYLASSVNWSPNQVFVDTLGLTASTAAPASLPVNTFKYVAGTGLYVNAGGPNPGTRSTFVGRRIYGIRLSGKAWVEIRGFTLMRQEDRAIYLSTLSNYCTVANNVISRAFKFGIGLSGSSNVLVEGNLVSYCSDHGIQLSNMTNSVVRRNESLGNLRPGQRAANGIYLASSTDNRIEGNRLHHNQDTGIHFQAANNNLSINNRSWANGDHGYDHLSTSGVVHIGDIAYGNYKDGFSIEGNSPGNTVMNCIAINNGLTSDEFDVWVDPASSVGFVSDYNIFWNSNGQDPIKVVATRYPTIASYTAASGNDAHSLQLDPMFVNPEAADFHLRGGSPAIDNANASITGWSAIDAEGNSRHDDPSSVNQGIGSIAHGDRGALEFQPPTNGSDNGPIVTAPVTVTVAEGGQVAITVTASDPDGQAIDSLTANVAGLGVGNNAVMTTNETHTVGTLSWTPSYTDGRVAPYVVSFTAWNALSATASTSIMVTNVDRAPVITVPTTKIGGEGSPITIVVMVHDPDGDVINTVGVDTTGTPAAYNATLTMNAAKTSGSFVWVPSFTDSGGPYRLRFYASNSMVGDDTTWVTVTNVDRAPVVSAPAADTIAENAHRTFTVTAQDPDGSPIGSLTATSLPEGASFVADPSGTSGTFQWTPDFNDAGGPYNVTFSATNILIGSKTTPIMVTNVDRSPVTVAPDTVTATEGNALVLPVTAADPDGQIILALNANLSGLPSGEGSFVAGSGNTSGTLSWTPDFDDAPGPYTVSFTAQNDLSASATTVIRVVEEDRAPVVTVPSTAIVVVGRPVTITVAATDPDLEPLNSLQADLNGLPSPAAASFVSNETHSIGTLSWTPTVTDLGGPYVVTFSATNNLTGTATQTILVERAPVVSAPASQNAVEGQATSFTVTASDPDSQPIDALTAQGLPAGANRTIDAAHTQGTFSWTPGFSVAPDSFVVHFTAANNVSSTCSTVVRVANVDRAPIVTAPTSDGILDGEPQSIVISAADPDGDAITQLTADLSHLPTPNNAVFTTNGAKTSGTVTWTPAAGSAAAGPYPITFTASNALSGTATTQMTGDRPPLVTTPATVNMTENVAASFTVTANDPDADTIVSLVANGMPAGATFTPDASHTSGTFSWTPGYSAAPGPVVVTFTAANTASGTASTSIAIANVDRAPAVSAPASVSGAAGSPLSFTITASDPDGETIGSLGAAGLPSGATFTANAAKTAGTFQWTPAAGSNPGPYGVTFTASNAMSGGATSTITLDRAPVITAPSAQTVAENTPASFVVSVTDPDGQAITSLTATGMPGGATFTVNGARTSGTVNWTPGFSDAPGPYVISFTATNSLTTVATTSISVTNTDRAPVISAPSITSVGENSVLSLPVTVSDADGDAINSLTANLSGLPTGNNAVFTANANKTAGTLTWIPTSNDGRGTPYTITFSATNAMTGVAATSITVVDAIANLCSNPSFETNTSGWNGQSGATVARVAGGHDGAYSLQVQGPGSTQFGANDAPNFVTNSSTGTRYRYTGWVRSAAHTGNVQFRVREYQPSGPLVATSLSPALTLSPTWTYISLDHVAVGNGNSLDFQALDTPKVAGETFMLDHVTVFVATATNPPVVTVPAYVSGTELSQIVVNVGAADPDGESINSLTANLSGLPAGHNAVFTPNATHTAGVLTWTPTLADAPGPYQVTFTAENGQSGSSTTTFSITNIDRAPVVTSPASMTVAENNALTFTVTASDPDGEAIASFPASGLPPGATFTTNPARTSGTFSWVPSYSEAPGLYAITFTASNALSGNSSTTVTVTNVDRAPVVTAPASQSILERTALTFTVTAADPDWESISSLVASGLPTGAVFTPNASNTSGTFSWTPDSTQAPGSYAVSFTGTNALAASVTCSITVVKLDHAPQVTAAASFTVAENQPLSFTISASDIDGHAITALTASGMPAGAVFTPNASNTSATFTWTPAFNQAPGPYAVIFTATNAASGADTTTISVTNVDRAPTISAPASLNGSEGTAMTFTVTAGDPDGEAITSLTASGLPAGATFTCDSTKTHGTFSWTPGFAAAGSYTVSFAVANALNATCSTAIAIANVDRAPVITASANASVTEGNMLTLVLSVSDPDGEAIDSLTANLAALPAGHNAVFTTGAGNTSATLTWTPTSNDGRPAPYNVTFTAGNVAQGVKTTAIAVYDPIVNLCANPSFETNLTGWAAMGTATLTRVLDGVAGSYACQIKGPTTPAQFGLNDSPNIVTNVTGGVRYRFSASVRSLSTAGKSKLRIREYTPSGVFVSSVFSNEITLSSTWTRLVVESVASGSGNYLDIQALDTPLAGDEIFLVDSVMVCVVTGSTAPEAKMSPVTPMSVVVATATATALEFGATVAPNPARGPATLSLSLPESGSVRADLYDVRGARVRNLADGFFKAGRHAFAIDGRDARGDLLPAGVYFYRVEVGGASRNGRVILVR